MQKLRRVSGPIKSIGCMLLALPVALVFAGSLVHVLWSAKEASRQASCSCNMRQVQLGLLAYTADWDETLPAAAHWATLSKSAVKGGVPATYWHCPGAVSRFSYAFNRVLGGLPLSDLEAPAATISLFECSSSEENTAGGPQDRTQEERHHGGLMYAFLDGHAKWMSREYADQQPWQQFVDKQNNDNLREGLKEP